MPSESHQYGESQEVTLIKRVARGEQSALGELYDATSSQVFGLLVRMLSNRAVAEETLLDVYKQAWRQAELYDPARGRPMAWLLTIARTRALDRIRSSKREQQLAQAISTGNAASSASIDPEQSTLLSEQQRIVRAALDTLPPEQREVIELAYYSGLSQNEIAARLDYPLGTVKTRTRLAMMKLRELLSP